MDSDNKEAYFEDLFTDISSILEDLCESGFHTVHDSTLQELKEKGETAARCGMHYLSKLLLALQEELSQSRHRISGDKNAGSSPAKYYAELIESVELGKEKIAYDKGKNYYFNEKEA